MKIQYAVHRKIIEGKLCRFWFDNDDILCIEANDNLITADDLKHDYLLIAKELDGRKARIFYDASSLQPIEKRIRLMLEEMLESVGVSLAITSQSRVGRTIANIFLALTATRIPMKMHADRSSAFAWLKEIPLQKIGNAV